jgi:hypothetical protein
MARTVHVHDPAVIAAIHKLPPDVAYGPRQQSFLKHLLCTWRILADWRMPVAVCRAGFLHSVYSTSYYPHALFGLEQRDVIRGLIGADAEELVFRFCTMDRRRYWDELATHPRRLALTYPNRMRGGSPVRVSRQTLKHLLMIESANLAEQGRSRDFGPAPWMWRIMHWWKFLDVRSIPLRVGVRPALTRTADERAIEAYRSALRAPGAEAASLLDRSIRLNPWAAEPRIMRGLCALEDRDERARVHAHEGFLLLKAWASPWDKRLTLNGWLALAQRIEAAAAGRSVRPPRFAPICGTLEKRVRMPRWLAT